MNYLKFIPAYISEILHGEKWLTVRYGLDEVPQEGDIVPLVNSATEESFALAEIHWVTKMTIKEFANKDWEGHRNYKDAQDMIDKLSFFYDGEELEPHTELTLIGFEVVEELQ